MYQNHAFETRFQKFYLIRVFQIFEQKTIKQGFKEIKNFSLRQSTIEKYQWRRQQIHHEGDSYLSNKEYEEFFDFLLDSPDVPELNTYLEKKLINSKKYQPTIIKTTVQNVIDDSQQIKAQLPTSSVIQNYLQNRSLKLSEHIPQQESQTDIQKIEPQVVKIEIKWIMLAFFCTGLLYTATLFIITEI